MVKSLLANLNMCSIVLVLIWEVEDLYCLMYIKALLKLLTATKNEILALTSLSGYAGSGCKDELLLDL